MDIMSSRFYKKTQQVCGQVQGSPGFCSGCPGDCLVHVHTGEYILPSGDPSLLCRFM